MERLLVLATVLCSCATAHAGRTLQEIRFAARPN